MFWKYLKLTLVGAAVLCLPNCGHEQQLVSIAVQPATETFGAANIPVSQDTGLNVQLKALGTYIHPPVTKDISNQVTWFSNTPQMVTVTPAGIITATGGACGNTLVSATMTTNHSVGNLGSSGAIVTGFMTANVVCFTGSGSGVGPVLTANFAGAGSGTITSTPPGMSCASTCSGSFSSGTTVTLTAAPNAGFTFGGWTNCDSVSGSGLVCTVNNLTANRGVTVTFN